MPSANTLHDAVVVLRIRHPNHNASLRADIREASKRQRVLARTTSYRDHNYTVTEYAAHDMARRKIKQRLENVTRRSRTNGVVLARFEDPGLNPTSTAAGSGRLSGQTTLEDERQAVDEERFMLQRKKCKKGKQSRKKKPGPRDNRHRRDQQPTSTGDAPTSVTRGIGHKRQHSRSPTIICAPLASHHPTSKSLPILSPANSSAKAGLADERPGQVNSRNGNYPIPSRGKKSVDHSEPAYHGHLTIPAVLRLTGASSDFDEALSKRKSVQSEEDILNADTVDMYESLAKDASKEMYDLEASTGLMTIADWGYPPQPSFDLPQQRSACNTRHTPQSPPSRDSGKTSGLVACGRKIKTNVKCLLRLIHKIPSGNPRDEKWLSIDAWRKRVVDTQSIDAQCSIDTLSIVTEFSTIPFPAEAPGDESFYQLSSSPAIRPGCFHEAGSGARRSLGSQTVSPGRQSRIPRSPRSGGLDAQEVEGEERYEMEVMESQQGSGDIGARQRFRNHPLYPLSVSDDDGRSQASCNPTSPHLIARPSSSVIEDTELPASPVRPTHLQHTRNISSISSEFPQISPPLKLTTNLSATVYHLATTSEDDLDRLETFHTGSPQPFRLSYSGYRSSGISYLPTPEEELSEEEKRRQSTLLATLSPNTRTTACEDQETRPILAQARSEAAQERKPVPQIKKHVKKHIPRLSSFRTSAELWQYIHPESDRAELPAYEEVMRKDVSTPATMSRSWKGKTEPADQGSSGSSGHALVKLEDMWLYTPRSCTTCGDFGLLPLHYCAECRKLRVDMCSDCYSMGHSSCQKVGHEVLETGGIQDIPNAKIKAARDPDGNNDSAIRLGEDTAPSHIFEKLLTFLAEERSFMRDELKRARSWNGMNQQLAARDRAETTALRIAKLKALPALITNEEGRRKFEAQESLRSVKDVAYLLPDADDTDAAQADVIPALQTSKMLEQNSLETKLAPCDGTMPNRSEPSLPDDSPKKVLSSAFQSMSQEQHTELADMDSKLRRQEHLQSFRDRELHLREKELELRERESLLQRKEKRFLAPEHLSASPLETPHSSVSFMPASLTSQLNCRSELVGRSLPVPDTPSKRSDSDSEFQSPCSKMSMSQYGSISCTSSPSGSPPVPVRDRFQVSAILIKRILSNFFLHRPRKGIRTHTGNRARQKDSFQHATASTKIEPGSSVTARKRAGKSLLARSYSHRSDRSGTDSGSNKRRRKTSSTKAISGRLLACPYAKFDPIRYSSSNQDESDYRRCSSHCLRDIPRLKQHLYRVHQRPEHHCPRCFATFDSKLDASEHARLPVPCATALCPFSEKFDADQLRELKRRQQGKNEVESWFFIYRVLFPNTELPADPYLENSAALLASQLSSPGASQSLGQMVIAHAGILDPESQARLVQAIGESLPDLVQQLLQRPVASTNSSSTSLPESATTPGSSSGNDIMAPETQNNPSGLRNAARISDFGASDRPWAPSFGVNGYNLPNSHAGSLMSQQWSPYFPTPAAVINTHVRTDATHPYLGANATDIMAVSLTGRQHSSQLQDNNHYSLNGNGLSAAASIPISRTSDRRTITASSIRRSDASMAAMEPPPVPQQALYAATLKPRRSMDSGYVSMHNVTSGDAILADPITSSFDLSSVSDDSRSEKHPGTITTHAASGQRSNSFNKSDGKIEGMSQSLLALNDRFSEIDQINHIYDSSTGILSVAEQNLSVPDSYLPEDAGDLGRASDISSVYLPSMSPLNQEFVYDSANFYNMVDESRAGNPWL